jgi:hypothetical protein
MAGHSIILIGGPDSGKTNYMARLWLALFSGCGCLRAPDVPAEIKYVEAGAAHLLQGQFAPRSQSNLEEEGYSFVVPVVASADRSADRFDIVVPDILGELWKKAVETCELPQQWMDTLAKATGALLFVRVGSEQNVDHLDWVTTADLLRTEGPPQNADDIKKRDIPTQVALCELLRFVEHMLGADNAKLRPRVAVLITAWDRLDHETAAAGPLEYLRTQYPLFAGRLLDVSTFDVRAFGVSVVSGDFTDEAFRQKFLAADVGSFGYVVEDIDGRVEQNPDITRPVAWVVKTSDP